MCRRGSGVARARTGILAEARDSARRGAQGRRARARCGPNPSRSCRDAYFSQSRCRRPDPAPEEQHLNPGSAEVFASRARRVAKSVSPSAAAAALNFGQLRPGSAPGTSQVRSERNSCLGLPPGRPVICRLALSRLNWEVKVRSLLRWEQLCPPGRWLRDLRAPDHWEPRPLLSGRALVGFPVLGSRPSPGVWTARSQTFKCQLLPLESGNASVLGCPGPFGCPFPQSAARKPWVSSASPLPATLPGLPTREPSTALPHPL